MARTLLCLTALFASANGLVSHTLNTRVVRDTRASTTLNMKLFDWKRREADESAFGT